MALTFPPMADVRPTVLSTAVVTIMAVVGILFLKFIANRFDVPGLREVMNAV